MTSDGRDPADVLARARRDWSPRAGDAERVRRAVGVALATGAGGSATAGPPGAPTWTARILVAGAIAAASGGVGYWAGRHAGLREARPVAPILDLVHRAPAAPPIAPPAERAVPEAQPPLAPPAPVASHRGGRTARHGSESATPADSSLTVELRALRNTERALRDGNPGLALAFLEELDRQVPHGQLTEERDAAGTLARCARGDHPFGVNLGDEFVRRYPASVYRARVEQACATTDPAASGDSPVRRSRE
jgi:hypothetical protein